MKLYLLLAALYLPIVCYYWSLNFLEADEKNSSCTISAVLEAYYAAAFKF